MKAFSVCGISGSGKTTTIENIIRELKSRNYKVGSVKEIHFEGFSIDPNPTSNTRRHREAGAELVCARGENETDLLYPEKLTMSAIFSFYDKDYDWLVLEGVDDIPVPTIVTAHALEDLEKKWSDMSFCVSGRISESMEEYKEIPSINSITDIRKLVDLIELKVYDVLPQFPPQCCDACGMSCETLGSAILQGKKRRVDCVADKGIELICGGRKIKMVPFVQALLKNAVLGVVSELEGYEKGQTIEIRL